MSYRNLRLWLDRADPDDLAEGAQAYPRYHQVMRGLAEHYGFTLEQTTAAFAALSPNSDYVGNLRSAASLLRGIRMGAPCEDIRVSGYNHARDRAYLYATGQAQFLDHAKGLKTRAFYRNLVDPLDWYPVTVDGHMALAYEDREGTMKQAVVSVRQYRTIADALRRLADESGMVPNQLQASIWFARKRTLGILYNPQLSLFTDQTDKWNTVLTPDQIKPWPLYSEQPLQK